MATISSRNQTVLWLVLVIWRAECDVISSEDTVETDKRGYLMFAVRNQPIEAQVADFIGALVLAKTLNRTIVLMPLIDEKTQKETLFETYFNLKVMQRCHKAVTLTKFSLQIADKVWWYEDRALVVLGKGNIQLHPVKFYESLGFEFPKIVNWNSMTDIKDVNELDLSTLETEFPTREFQALALDRSPPFTDPILQTCFYPTKEKIGLAEDRIRRLFGKFTRKFIGISLPMKSDTKRCDIDEDDEAKFVSFVKEIIERIGVRRILIVSDQSLRKELTNSFGDNIRVEYTKPDFLSLYIMTQGKAYVASCHNSYSQFVLRHRKYFLKGETYFMDAIL